MGMDWEWVGLACASAFDIVVNSCVLRCSPLATCSQDERDMEFQLVLQTLDKRRLPAEMATTSSRAEERAPRWSRSDGGNEEGAPFARRAGGPIPSSAEAVGRAGLGGRLTKQGGVGMDEVGWGQRTVLQAVRHRGVKTLSIRTRPPSPQSIGNATLPSSLATASQGGAPRQDPSRETSLGNQQYVELGLPLEAGVLKGLASLRQEQGMCLVCIEAACYFWQEIKWQATLQHQWEASGKPSFS